MTKAVRYQRGQLYREHGAWFVRYRDRVREGNGSIKLQRRTKRLGSVEEFPTKSDIEPLRAAFMQKINAGQFSPESSMTLSDFVETVYLPWVKAERRASTYKGYKEIWENHILKRVGQIRLREFRTVRASKMLRAIAAECDLAKTTLQHIKSVLSAIFTYAKNEGAYDGTNPVQGAMIPGNARDPEETYAYNLVQILRILEFLPLLPRAVVGTASFAGLREGELRGLEWQDYAGDALAVNRSIWKGVVNKPKTRASRQPVPVIPKLAKILDEYRTSMNNPETGVMFHNGNGAFLDMYKLARMIRPAVEAAGLPWYGWHGFRRGIASNLYELGANDKIVQRILRHAKPHVTKERYIKAFDPAVLEAMQRMQATLDVLEKSPATVQQIN
ncbi:MAG TPA: tyrosine-type recombinase/integrase [Candidatus Bathyarchaeia archaeon]|nr:tyrosine-type recombinase/integrase [Candidatus Bathyarchaeia archaeon]